MKKYKILIGLFIVFYSCRPLANKKTFFNVQLSRIIFSDSTLKNSLERAFYLGDKCPKVFKVLISRRDSFVRITIYQIIAKVEKKEYPSTYFSYNNKFFLCYDGSELVENKRMDSIIMNNINLKLQPNSLILFNSRVIQFDLDENKNIKLNMPAINPYDFNFKQVHFPPRNKHKH